MIKDRQPDLAALANCLETVKHLFIDNSRLEHEPEYEEKRGGYGDVCVCTLDSGTPVSKLVAAKTIRLRARNKEHRRLAFRLARELKVWAGLQHAHILPLLGYYLDKDYKIAILISEYMTNGDLKDYIEKENPPWNLRLQLVRDSTDGLAYLHGQNPPIRHGDLKMVQSLVADHVQLLTWKSIQGNVLVTLERRAMLADFGLSKSLVEGGTGLTTSDSLKGTLRYYSPDLIEGTEAGRHLPSDIWAWACLNLEVLTDRMPYAQKNTEHAIILALVHGESPCDVESLTFPIQDLKPLLARCWNLEPSERPSALECLDVLNTALLALQPNINLEGPEFEDDSLEKDAQRGAITVATRSTGSKTPTLLNLGVDPLPNLGETADYSNSGANDDHFGKASVPISQAVRMRKTTPEYKESSIIKGTDEVQSQSLQGPNPYNVDDRDSSLASTSSTRFSLPPAGRRTLSYEPSELAIITVTADAENYLAVNITGAENAVSVRERIFSKLQISDEDQENYQIYRMERGEGAFGDPLTDEWLMIYCGASADAEGTLMFIVQRNPSAPTPEPQFSAETAAGEPPGADRDQRLWASPRGPTSSAPCAPVTHPHSVLSPPSPSPISSLTPTSGTDCRSPPSGLQGVVIIMATADGESFSAVNITGTEDAASIRERMFSKLRIPDSDQGNYQIFRTELGEAVLGDPVEENLLMTYCEAWGDAKGALKFLIQRKRADPPPQPSTRTENPPSPSLSPPPSVTPTSDIDGRDTWMFRPIQEDVLDHLQDFFPDHDLDKPFIDQAQIANEGLSSPGGEALLPPVPLQVSKEAKFRHRTSIRLVAEERRKLLERIGSATEPTANAPNLERKRSTKLWGSKVEEVTPGQGKSGMPPTSQESPTGPASQSTIKWVKGELIGKGTYGRVFLAFNVTTGEMMAVKQVEMPQTITDQDDVRQVSIIKALEGEQQTLEKLMHPNIVQYFGFEKTKEFFSIFFEYVPGGSIGSCLRRHGKFEESIIKSFTGQIIDGLAYLHANKIIHRDIKADNVLVDPSGNCKISDFGISKQSEVIYNNAAMTAMQGSLFWMAPEMLHNEKKGYSAKVDIWSLGCVFIEMFAGRRPWGEDDFLSVMFKVGRHKMAPPVPSDAHLSAEAEDLRLKCFTEDPDERPTAESLKGHPWLNLPPGWIFSGFH